MESLFGVCLLSTKAAVSENLDVKLCVCACVCVLALHIRYNPPRPAVVI